MLSRPLGLFLAGCLIGPSVFVLPLPAQPAPSETQVVDPAPTAATTAGEADEPAAADLESSPGEIPLEAVDEEYFQLLRLFADTLDQVERNYVKQVSRRELMEAAIQGVLAKLDEYSDYIAPDQLDTFRRGVENEFGGIGIRVGVIDGKLTVVTPLIDTPAYRAGILAGDRILQVGEASTEGMSLEDAIERMKGKIGSEISLTVGRDGETETRQVTLQRELVRMETVFGDTRLPNDRWQYMYDDQHKIGYIRISSFSRHTAEDLRVALQQLTEQGMKALILDLRFDPGGLLSTAIEVADLFLPEGTIVSTSGRNVTERTWSASEPGTFLGFEMVVLVNKFSASASEIVAASLQDHDRAVIMGERTWGKGSVQNIIEMEGGRSALKLTTAGYKRPSGKNIHRFDGASDDDDWGVRPDEGFLVPLSPNEMRRLMSYHGAHDILPTPATRQQPPAEVYVDRQLQAALDYLRGKLQGEQAEDAPAE